MEKCEPNSNFKKGDVNDLEKNSPISLPCVLYKLFTKVIPNIISNTLRFSTLQGASWPWERFLNNTSHSWNQPDS